jgi:sialic acid synthase SpsE
MNKIEIIAEIGQNHNGDMALAKELIHAAKESGADVAKFQAYDAKDLFPVEGNPWFEYNCKTELSKTQLEDLKQECDKCNIEFMTSVFDTKRIDWCEELGVKRYKIASRSIHDKDLIEALAKTNKDLITSLGFWKEPTFPIIKSNAKVSYLYCVSEYPTPLNKFNFKNIDFNTYQGFSDHSEGLSASIAALARGAKILERHFTLDKKHYGPDHALSITANELKFLHEYRQDLEECIS